jgi:hypothetical protein
MQQIMQLPLTGVGLVDLDTSHPQAWIPILRDLGYCIAGVYDGGTVYPDGYAQQFAAQNGIPHVFDSPEAMAAHPDIQIAIVHSCNWDLHVSRAAPFVAQGKAVLVDKPLAGNLAELRQFKAWLDAGTRITGGSSLRYAPEVRAFRKRTPVKPRAVFAGCGVDEFNYGIHAYSMIAGMLGPGIVAARHNGIRDGMQQIELSWRDGGNAMLVVGGGAWLPFYATVIHAQSVEYLEAKVETLYRALLEQVMPYLSGATTEPPTPYDVLIEPELAAMAARLSQQRDGIWVRLDELAEGQTLYDGAEFGHAYRASKLGVK